MYYYSCVTWEKERERERERERGEGERERASSPLVNLANEKLNLNRTTMGQVSLT